MCETMLETVTTQLVVFCICNCVIIRYVISRDASYMQLNWKGTRFRMLENPSTYGMRTDLLRIAKQNS